MEMKRLYHLCISSKDEVLFRCEEDYRVAVNCLALSLFKTETDLLSDSFMSNHLHLALMTKDVVEFARNIQGRYSIYFGRRYGRRNIFRDASSYYLEIEGARHILAALSYVNRNGLHHGQCGTAFGYGHSSVNCFFRSELGKSEKVGVLASRAEMNKYLPRHSEYPDTYVMDKNGMFVRESFVQVSQVEVLFGSPRAFLYYMNRLSSEKWYQEQNDDKNGKMPVTLDIIESGTTNAPIAALLKNEFGKYNKSMMNDMDVCGLVDNDFVPRFGKSSVYQLSTDEKKRIAAVLFREYHISDDQIKRCLVL